MRPGTCGDTAVITGCELKHLGCSGGTLFGTRQLVAAPLLTKAVPLAQSWQQT